LAAFIALASARRAARLDAQLRYAPLLQQDTGHWDHALIAQGEAWLFAAHGLQRIGRFQLEAAIQSAHLDRARSGRTDWPAVALLYEGLLRMAPSLGAVVGRALAVAHMQGPLQGLAALCAIDDVAQGFQPYWAARTDLLARAGRRAEALDAAQRAIELARGGCARSWLVERARDLGSDNGWRP
jgi:RNA polymerase sigma-70 factor (ECF subfamily)